MAALEGQARPTATLSVAAMVLGLIIGLLLGLFASIFGPYYPVAVGAGLAILGGIGISRRGRWGRFVLMLGIAVIAGAMIYLAIGLLTPDGASSGSGSGCVPSAFCE